MVDLNMLPAYTIKGQLEDDKEHLLEYEDVKLGGGVYAENKTIVTLIGLASAKVRWSNEYFLDFDRCKADVTDAIKTSHWLDH